MNGLHSFSQGFDGVGRMPFASCAGKAEHCVLAGEADDVELLIWMEDAGGVVESYFGAFAFRVDGFSSDGC